MGNEKKAAEQATENVESLKAALAAEQAKNEELTKALSDHQLDLHTANENGFKLKTELAEEQAKNEALTKALTEHKSEIEQALAINTDLQNRLKIAKSEAPAKGPVVKVEGKTYEIMTKAVHYKGKVITAADLAANEAVAKELVKLKSKILRAV